VDHPAIYYFGTRNTRSSCSGPVAIQHEPAFLQTPKSSDQNGYPGTRVALNTRLHFLLNYEIIISSMFMYRLRLFKVIHFHVPCLLAPDWVCPWRFIDMLAYSRLTSDGVFLGGLRMRSSRTRSWQYFRLRGIFLKIKFINNFIFHIEHNTVVNASKFNNYCLQLKTPDSCIG